MNLTWPCNRCGVPIEARYAAADPFDPAPFNTRLYRAGTEERHVCPKPRKDRPLNLALIPLPGHHAGQALHNGGYGPSIYDVQRITDTVRAEVATIVTEMREDRAHVEWEMRQ